MEQNTLNAPPAEDVEAFAMRMAEVLNHSALSIATSIGHRTELFDTMSRMPPSTCEEIAGAAGLDGRYVREWLAAMVTGRIVRYDADGRLYSLPAAHAACLTRAAGSNNIAVTAQFLPVVARVEDEVVKCFENGGGVPYESFDRFHEVMAEDSGNSVVGSLVDHILPIVPGLTERLEQGIDVLDIGCGSGRAINLLARTFPNSRFTGYDLCADAIDRALAEAGHHGTTNVRFAARDVTRLPEADAFDLITAFDAIHDQAEPALVLAGIARALRQNGTFLMQDIRASSHLHENLEHPFAPFLYMISTMHCMTVSLAQGGQGLGTMWGEQLALSMLADAGFSDVRVEQLEHDVLNSYFIARL